MMFTTTLFSTLTLSLLIFTNAVPLSSRQNGGNYGQATYYHTGLGNCGQTNYDGDVVIALSTTEYGDGRHCGQRVRIKYNNNSIEATVADSCPGCQGYDVDLSPAAFKALAPLDAGRIWTNWEYIL